MAGILVGFPLLDLMAQVSPVDMPDPLWRSRATARLGEGLPSILFGFFTAFTVALLLRHKRTLRVLSVAFGASALVCAASLLAGAWDFWEVHSLLPPQEALAFSEASFAITMKYLAAFLLLSALAAIAWEASPRAWRRPRRGPLVDLFARSGRVPEGTAPGVPEDLVIVEVGVANGQAPPANAVNGEGETPFEAFADGERASEGDRDLVPAGRDIEPVAASEPDGVSGNGSKGGKKRRPGRDPETGEEIPAPPDDVLRSEVQALVDSGESLTGARRTVGRKYGIGVTTVRNRTK